jgi:hypothetical protein
VLTNIPPDLSKCLVDALESSSFSASDEPSEMRYFIAVTWDNEHALPIDRTTILDDLACICHDPPPP